jgi:large subunit ribosomal protein L10
MTKLKAGQALKIKTALSEHAKFKMARKPLLLRALKESGKRNIENVLAKANGSVMLILSDLDPFRLFALIKKNRAKASAKVGDVVKNDVIVPKGPTTLSPGPAITVLQKAGLKTRVEGGKIAVSEDKKVLKANDSVTSDIAGMLQLLNIQPLEIGLNMQAAWEDGLIYDRDILDVSLDEYVKCVDSCVTSALNLSISVGWPTKENVFIMLQKAFIEARGLAVSANIVDVSIIGELLAKACREASCLGSLLPKTESKS